VTLAPKTDDDARVRVLNLSRDFAFQTVFRFRPGWPVLSVGVSTGFLRVSNGRPVP
jgi:hypothetical protein